MIFILPHWSRVSPHRSSGCHSPTTLTGLEPTKWDYYFQATKLAFFTSNKDKTSLLSCSGLVYSYSCPGCAKSYIGKTDNTLFNRTKQHGWSDKDSAIGKHFRSCQQWKDIVGMFGIEDEGVDHRAFQINTVRNCTKILKRSDNWLKLAFLESLAIKEHSPELNSGIRSCKDLSLFGWSRRVFDVRSHYKGNHWKL